MRFCVIAFALVSFVASMVQAADYALNYPPLIDVMEGATFYNTNNAGIWYYYPPLNLWTPDPANVGSATSSTNTLIHSHNIWSAYNMMQRNTMIKELREMKAAIQALDLSVVVNVEGGGGDGPPVVGGGAALPDTPFGDMLTLINDFPLSGFSGGVPPGFASYEDWTAYYSGVRADIVDLDAVGRSAYAVAVQAGHMRYLIVQADELLTWQKVQALAVCAVAAAAFLGIFIAAIKIKYPL